MGSDIKTEMKHMVKSVLKKYWKKILIIAIPIVIILIILSAATYFITIDDGTYKEGDWSNTNYGASQYINSVTVNSDGTITNSMTAEELWKKMKKNGCRVNKYLSSPEELARLMRAEIVTKFLDTRENPDEEIKWEDLVEDGDNLQGIIKLKRADSNNNKTTMKYVDPETFQGYIDEYNRTGSESAKNNGYVDIIKKC